MIQLRELQTKDVPYMFEWMHDVDIQKYFKKDMGKMTIEDVTEFCERAIIKDHFSTGDSVHYAIVDSKNDEYIGTVSLKDIDLDNGTAEYAIVTRKEAHGKGVGFLATGLVLEKAFHEIGLHRVFLNVYSNNAAAIRLYEKCGFRFEGEFREHFIIDHEYVNWKWYGILDREYDKSLFVNAE